MKNLFSALILMLVIGIIIAPSVSAQTTYGTTITNSVTVEGLNFGNQTNTVTTNVQRIVGSGWAGQADDQGATPGSFQQNISSLTNYGNDTINFQLSVVDNAEFGGGVTSWPWAIYTNGDLYLTNAAGGNAGPGGNIALASADAIAVTFQVSVDIAATAATQAWRLQAITPDIHANTNTYQGDNGTWYGGSVASGWGMLAGYQDAAICYAGDGTPGVDGSTTLYSITTTSAPIISITKSITGISDVSGAGVDIVIPGARLTYQIRVSNAEGAGPASGVIVRDDVNSSYVTLDSGSSLVGGASTEANWNIGENGTVLTWTNAEALMEAGNVAYLTFTAVVN